MYKIELHLHTALVSPCGKLSASEIADGYAAAGYDGVVVTDHYKRKTFEYIGIDPSDSTVDRLGAFLAGYEAVCAECEKRGIRVYRGAEITFDGSPNDYLVFGWPDSLLADPEKVISMGLADFSAESRKAGALLVQAHPYRGRCTPADPEYLDGAEVLNAHPRHDDKNSDALAFAEKNCLIKTAGSDCHRTEDIGRAGILCETLPTDEEELVRIIRSGDYTIFGKDTP